MARLLVAFVISLSFLLSACGGGGGGGASAPLSYARVARSALPVGDTTCPAGGILVQTGFDLDRDRVLDANEVVDSEKVCNGTAGTDGASGLTALVNVTDVAAGGLCGTATGEQIDAGLDANGDGTLASGEISRTSYLCNGVDGIDGTNGTNGLDAFQSLVKVTAQGASTTCPAGGNRIDFGLDLNANGLFDQPAELVQWTLVCNGVNGSNGSNGTNGTNGTNGLASLIAVTGVAPDPATCPTGGQQIQSGLDDNGNGTLDAPAEVDATAFVCNGAAASPGLNSLVSVSDIAPGDATCAAGGKLVASGLDDNANGTLEAGEIDASNKVCNGVAGSDGYNSLIATTVLAVGSGQCPDGGTQIDSGLDTSRDGVLDPGEITATSYACNVVYPVLSTTTVHPELCLHGATVTESGLDLDLDGTLDAGEVTASSTVCQNNAAPSFKLWYSDYFGTPVSYDAMTRSWSIGMYNGAALTLELTADDANLDPVTVTLPASPPTGVYMEEMAPADLPWPYDMSLPDAPPRPTGQTGVYLTTFGTLAAGNYDLVTNVTDTEAGSDYHMLLDVRDASWQFTPFVAHEGVDAYAEGTVSFPQPLLMDMAVEANWPDFPFSGTDLEICTAPDTCQPAANYTSGCMFVPWLGYDVCGTYYWANRVTIPAGTTSFTLRRPIADDAVWGAYNQLSSSLSLVLPGGGATPFPSLYAAFTVIDNDTGPTVEFVDNLMTIVSGETNQLQIQSSLADVTIPLLFSGTAANGVDYTASAWVTVDASGVGYLSISTALNELLSGDIVVHILFDTSYGVTPGTNASADVTITPPPPLTVQFNSATESVDRYSGYYCSSVVLNRLSYIQDVTVNYSLSGTAIEGTDYNLDTLPAGQLDIPAGSDSGLVCFQLPGNESASDVTLQVVIDSATGAAVGANADTTVTLLGGAFPSFDFAAASNSDLMTPDVQQACLTLGHAGGAMPFYSTDVTVQLTPSSPALAPYLQASGFSDMGDGTWQGTLNFYDGGATSGQVCLSRPAGYATTPIGDYSVALEIIDAGAAHVGTTQPTATMDIHQPFGTRYLMPASFDWGSLSGLDVVKTGESGDTLAVGAMYGQITGQTDNGQQDLAVIHVGIDGQTWVRQVGTPQYDDVVDEQVDEAGNSAVLLNYYGTGSGRQLLSLAADGTDRYAVDASDYNLLAMRNGVVLVENTASNSLQGLDATGAVAWTLTPADFGLTSCTSTPAFTALPIQGGTDFYVRVTFNPYTCTVNDIDTDGQSFYDQVYARVTGAGAISWELDDLAEVGVSALSMSLEHAEDAAGNLYLLDRFGFLGSLVKINAAGTPAWGVNGPSCGGSHFLLDHLSLDVSPAGKVAVGWRVDCSFDGNPQIGATDIAWWAVDGADGSTLQTGQLGGIYDDAGGWIVAKDDGSVVETISRSEPFWDILVWHLSPGGVTETIPFAQDATTQPTRLLDGDVMFYNSSSWTVSLYDANLATK